MADISNPFAAPTDHSNVILIVEGKKLHVSKEYLAIHSPVFDAMFFGDFVEKEEVEIKDVKFEEFVDLLNVIHPGWTPITATSVVHILKLADQFQMKDAREQAEVFHTKSRKVNIGHKLRVALEYNLLKLQDHCLKSITSPDLIPDVEAHEFAHLSDATKIAIKGKKEELLEIIRKRYTMGQESPLPDLEPRRR